LRAGGRVGEHVRDVAVLWVFSVVWVRGAKLMVVVSTNAGEYWIAEL